LYTERQRHREHPPDDAMPCAYRRKVRRIGLGCRKLPWLGKSWHTGSVAFALPSPGERATRTGGYSLSQSNGRTSGCIAGLGWQRVREKCRRADFKVPISLSRACSGFIR
jgi:hypothetical protein